MSKPLTVTVSVNLPRKLVEHVGRFSRLAVFYLASHPVSVAVVPHKWQGFAQGLEIGVLEVAYRLAFPTQPEPKALADAAVAAKVPEPVVEAVAEAVTVTTVTPTHGIGSVPASPNSTP